MSLYSIDLDQQKVLQESVKSSGMNRMSASVFNTPQPGGTVSTLYGFPILHDTVFEMTMEKIEPEAENDSFGSSHIDNIDFGEKFLGPQPPKANRSIDVILQVNGKVITPLKVGLSKQVFEQILQTLDNIAPETDGVQKDDDTVTILPEASSESLYLEKEDVDQTCHRPRSGTAFSDKSSSDQSVNKVEDKPVIIHGGFEMRLFEVNMYGDLGEGERGLVDLKLEDFRINFQRNDKWTKALELSLHSLVIEDLLQEPTSKHRNLMVSLAMEKPKLSPEGAESPYLSRSCPTSMIDIPTPSMPGSLPSNLNQPNMVWGNIPQTKQTKSAV